MPKENRQALDAAWEKQFGFLFDQLKVDNTKDILTKFVRPVPIHKSPSSFGVVDVDDSHAAKDLAD
jgi:hypothetical protein